jgi:hypothetical protein
LRRDAGRSVGFEDWEVKRNDAAAGDNDGTD